ncbi:MAG: hypothetical protein KC635_07625, partial [Myxococcales bacterium]|nr:hypothetical protein [Myxococcales bacterium]
MHVLSARSHRPPPPPLIARLVLAGALAASLVACGSTEKRPYSAADLARDSREGGGDALVRYLATPDADPRACDTARSDGPHVTITDPEAFEDLTDALVEGEVPAAAWRACMDHLSPSVGATPLGPPLAGALARAYPDAVEAAAGGSSPGAMPALEALHAVFLARPVEATSPAAARADAEEELRDTDPGSDPRVRAIAAEALAVLAMERGEYAGRPVDEAALATLDDVDALRLLGRRLPAAGLRGAARARAAHLVVSRSDDPDVKAHAGEAEIALTKAGVYAVEVGPSRLATGCSVDGARLPAVHVVQDVGAQEVKLAPAGGAQGAPLPLRDALRVTVDGFASPLALCPPAPDWSPRPCVPPAAVTAGGADLPGAVIGPAGGLLLPKDVPASALLGWLERGDTVTATLAVGDATCDAPLALELQAPAFELIGDQGGPGPDLAITAREARHVLILTVETGGQRYDLAVDENALGDFRVVSAGGQGRPGSPGRRGIDGMTGPEGLPASCPGQQAQSGGRGGQGQRGA